jgi:hypothetical protein
VEERLAGNIDTVLGLSELLFIDSTGIHLVISTARRAQSQAWDTLSAIEAGLDELARGESVKLDELRQDLAQRRAAPADAWPRSFSRGAPDNNCSISTGPSSMPSKTRSDSSGATRTADTPYAGG